jgi:hypothetical protein
VTPLGNYRCEYAKTVAEGVEITDTIETCMLDAGNLDDRKPRFDNAYVDERLDFKAVPPEAAIGAGPRSRGCI